ncbi:MAG: family 43 glycosylhydrolase, partial [Bacteroidales bacterium]|nr:family 43 glycosylhydrolase [Bacteroidales bacterium]
PVVLICQYDHFLFVSPRKRSWDTPAFKEWTYVDAPDYPGGVVSVVEKDGILYGCSMNNKNVYKCLDPKAGKWELTGTFDSDRYGDANMFVDDDGRLYLYYGWSQLMPFKVVELDPGTFKEISEPQVLFFSDYRNHGFEKRTRDDVIYSIFNGRRDYFEEEYPWIEGPWMTKHNGKYYLQYAAIGLELLSYSHGVYVADSPMGPFTYSPHNPLTFKTTGFAVGAGHGSTFHDKNGQLWTICMIPASYGGAGRGSELAIFPTAVDAEGVMHANVEFGDYPQFWPGTRTDAVDHNWTGWKLLSHKKRVIVSSTFEKYAPENGVDEDFMTNWAAETGDPGEFFEVDLGKVADIYAIQCNFDHIGAQMPARQGFGAPAPANPEYYQCFYVEVSQDGTDWTRIIDKSANKLDLHHDYTELRTPVQARYVKVVNARQCHDGAKFSMKDLRVFGNPYSAGSVIVDGVKVVRNPEDRREASLLWDPVPGADGYIVRYGIEPGKLYNSYIVYDRNDLRLHSLNTASDYFFEVESFDSGLDYYRPRSEAVNGTGGEVEINKRVPGRPGAGYGRDNQDTRRVMIKEGVDEYVFEGIDPGYWVINHSYGPVLWAGELSAADLVGDGEPGIEARLTEMGTGTQVTAEMWMKVVRGPQTGKVVLQIRHRPRQGGWPTMPGGGMGAALASPVVNPDNTVTFNYQDPHARSVKVNTQFAGTQEMTRDGNGIWTVTLGPVAPDMYPYSFDVDGVQVMDPLNPDWFPNETFKNSLVDVRGTGEPLIHALRDVPHGSVDYVNYRSESLGTFANAIVYTPPQYDKNKNKKYPVFYLISGTTDTEEVYFKVGRMNLILDNLIAEGKAREMIIVLPYGNPSKYFRPGEGRLNAHSFTRDLIHDLMPFVEKNYRTLNDRDHRAIGGFSRGGNQALSTGLTHLDRFSWLCSYSSFTSMDLPGVYDDAAALNEKLHLFWLGVGTDDFLYGNAKEYMDFLDKKGIRNVKVFTDDKFGHTWMNAKYFLAQSLPLLFQE